MAEYFKHGIGKFTLLFRLSKLLVLFCVYRYIYGLLVVVRQKSRMGKNECGVPIFLGQSFVIKNSRISTMLLLTIILVFLFLFPYTCSTYIRFSQVEDEIQIDSNSYSMIDSFGTNDCLP